MVNVSKVKVYRDPSTKINYKYIDLGENIIVMVSLHDIVKLIQERIERNITRPSEIFIEGDYLIIKVVKNVR
mgnify:CR=1 FL=1